MYAPTGPQRRLERAGRRHEEVLRAVLIAEPFGHRVGESLQYPLTPVSPSRRLPFALLPICNTPLIDYVLENLVASGVDEVTVLLNTTSFDAVNAHLSQERTARGKSWTMCDAIKVTTLECARRLDKLADAVSEMVDRNVVPQSGSFVFVPIDAVAVVPHLRDYFTVHLERAKTIAKYAATLLCTQSRAALQATWHNVLVRTCSVGKSGAARLGREEDNPPDSPSRLLEEPESPVFSSARSNADFAAFEPAGLLLGAVPARPKVPHTMFVLNKSNGVVSYMARHESAAEEMPEPPLLTFAQGKKAAAQSVRLDLVPTGFLFCCCEALALIEFHIRDLYSFLSTSLLGNEAIYGNVFGVLEVPAQAAVIEPVNSLESYLQANLHVSARRLFPLTRESSFADAVARYAVAVSCDTVYLHTTAKLLGGAQGSSNGGTSSGGGSGGSTGGNNNSNTNNNNSANVTSTCNGTIGPNVVVGEAVLVPASAQLVGTVLGPRVVLGEDCTLVSCVVLDGAVIGRGCTVRGSLIGYNAVLGDGAEVVNSIVGSLCVVGHRNVRDGGPVRLHDQVVLYDTDEDEGGAAAKQADVWATDEAVSAGRASSSKTSSTSNSSSGDDAGSVVSSLTIEDEHEATAGGGMAARQPLAHPTLRAASDAVLGEDGQGRELREHWVSDVAPTNSLFTDDPIPQHRNDDEEEGEESSEVDEWEAFHMAISKHVESALQQSSHIGAAAYDMSTVCLSYGFGYPELCETVTELLIKHLLTAKDGDKDDDYGDADSDDEHESTGNDEATLLQRARVLFGQWCRPFYNEFLSKNGQSNIEAMVATLEGLCAGISDPGCVLHGAGPLLVEILYNDCDEELYEEREYCIVSPDGLFAFDEAMRRQRRILEQHRHRRTTSSEATSSGAEDSDSDDDDVKEEHKVRVAESCHDFIMGVKAFVEDM